MPFLSSPSLGASAGLPPSPTVLTTRIVPPTVAYAILGIEAMAVEIENPFGYDFNDLPLGNAIC
jgi:predicted membrane chloride channel (bestrophin family)